MYNSLESFSYFVSIFTNNTSDGGIVIAGFTNIESSGVCQFIDNSGPALRVN